MRRGEYNKAVELHSGNLYRFLLKYMQDEDEAKDLVQETFLKLWNHRKDVHFEKAKSWLFTTANRAMLNRLKQIKLRNKANQEMNEEQFLMHHQMEVKEVVDKALLVLPPLQKSIILLRDLEGYNYKEIGEILDISESQVKVYLFRARQKVKEQIKDLNLVLQ